MDYRYNTLPAYPSVSYEYEVFSLKITSNSSSRFLLSTSTIPTTCMAETTTL